MEKWGAARAEEGGPGVLSVVLGGVSPLPVLGRVSELLLLVLRGSGSVLGTLARDLPWVLTPC